MTSQTGGRVASLHMHPEKSGEPLRAVEEIQLVEARGILGNGRYFGRKSRSGEPSKRQLTLIEREQISEHAATLGLPSLPPGVVRSNIETLGLDLVALVGRQVQVGTAIVLFYEPRTPCEKMDRLCPGLRGLMENGKQGVLAQVIRSGTVRIGDVVAAVT